MKPIVELKNISKYFMSSRAMHEVSLQISEGDCVGIVGHNGAGKSTLVNVLTGIFPPTSGEIYIDGVLQPPGYDIFTSNKQGIRAVFQELSLCPNLTVIENIRIFYPQISGVGWKKKATEIIMSVLDDIFPGHGVFPYSIVGKLTLGQRQMVEIAKAFTAPDETLRLVVLDEPTSALDGKSSEQLLSYLNKLKEKRLSVIYISHLLNEVIASTNRIMVMKDGIKVCVLDTATVTRDQIIEKMGDTSVQEGTPKTLTKSKKFSAKKDAEPTQPIMIEPKKATDPFMLTVRRGEVIGLTGLAGHGQTTLLMDLFDSGSDALYNVNGPVTFLPGDRQSDGVFPIWSIIKNISIQSLEKIAQKGYINEPKEIKIAKEWEEAIDIKAASLSDRISSLSGGNQQKVIFARCLESAADIVLMDDPTRGVDVGTKRAIYELILAEKLRGRSFVWYTTEMEELQYCDRLYVFKGGKIITELTTGEASAEDILNASF